MEADVFPHSVAACCERPEHLCFLGEEGARCFVFEIVIAWWEFPVEDVEHGVDM